MSDALAQTIIDTLRSSLGLTFAEIDEGTRGCTIEATNARGERWIAKDDTRYGAAVMLAEMLEFELEDG